MLFVALLLLLLTPGLACAQGVAPIIQTRSPPVSTPTNRSNTVTLGGQAQSLMAQNAARRGCEIQNLSSGDLWVSEVGTAAPNAPSRWLPSGAVWTCPPSGVPQSAISIYGGITGQPFMAREW